MTTLEALTAARISLNSAANRLAARESERKVTVRMPKIEQSVLEAVCAAGRTS
jgi:hypothetical protein